MSMLIDKDVFGEIRKMMRERDEKMQLSEEDATFNAEFVEPSSTQRVQSVGNVENRVPLDYISRQAAIRIISGYQDGTVDKSVAKRLLTQLPSADVVEVVRCKKCKYSSANYGAIVYCCLFKVKVNEEGYCYIGERRTDGVDC